MLVPLLISQRAENPAALKGEMFADVYTAQRGAGKPVVLQEAHTLQILPLTRCLPRDHYSFEDSGP